MGSYHDATPVVSLAALRGGGQNKPNRPSRTPGARRSREARENRGTEGKAVSQRDTRGGTRRRPWLTRIARSPSKPDAARARGAEALLQEGGREPHIEMQGRKSRPLLFSSPLPTDGHLLRAARSIEAAPRPPLAALTPKLPPLVLSFAARSRVHQAHEGEQGGHKPELGFTHFHSVGRRETE